MAPAAQKALWPGKTWSCSPLAVGAYPNGSPRIQYDYQEPYLRMILAYIGLTDVFYSRVKSAASGSSTAVAGSSA
jgi:hypothetical protein